MSLREEFKKRLRKTSGRNYNTKSTLSKEVSVRVSEPEKRLNEPVNRVVIDPKIINGVAPKGAEEVTVFSPPKVRPVTVESLGFSQIERGGNLGGGNTFWMEFSVSASDVVSFFDSSQIYRRFFNDSASGVGSGNSSFGASFADVNESWPLSNPFVLRGFRVSLNDDIKHIPFRMFYVQETQLGKAVVQAINLEDSRDLSNEANGVFDYFPSQGQDAMYFDGNSALVLVTDNPSEFADYATFSGTITFNYAAIQDAVKINY